MICSLYYSNREHIKGPFSEAVIMEKGLGRYIDKTSIKEAGLKICRNPPETCKAQIAQMEILMEQRRNISELSRISTFSIEELKP